jgi:hypothetical protein
LEEVDFFHEICLIALYASRSVKFAAVVDSKGKLILAKFRRFNMHNHRASISSIPGILDGAQEQQALLAQSCHSLCHEHLMPTLKGMSSRSYRDQYSNTAHFEITEIEIDKNICLKLAVTPLTESRDKFLCLVLQLPPKMRTDGHQQIISKLTNIIQ